MLKKAIKNGLLPKNPDGWKSVHDKLVNDKSATNLIDTATRILVSFIFDSHPQDQLETTIIHELSAYTDDVAELTVIAFKTAKMYSACLQNTYLLNGLYDFGRSENLYMKYSPSNYFFDNKRSMLVLDVDGKLKANYKKQVFKHISKLVKENQDANEVIEANTTPSRHIDSENIPNDITNSEADDLIDNWKNSIKSNGDVNN